MSVLLLGAGTNGICMVVRAAKSKLAKKGWRLIALAPGRMFGSRVSRAAVRDLASGLISSGASGHAMSVERENQLFISVHMSA